MNVKGEPAAVVQKISQSGFHVTLDQMTGLAQTMGEKTLFNRTAGAATLAVGMAQIFSKFTRGHWLDLWYHFAIMFEALFILTTLDAGTRVGRYLLQDVLGNVWKPLGETKNITANVLASVLIVGGWGYFLIQGVRDPLGGINSLWPLFGIANQLLAGIALCLGTTIILKMTLQTVSPQPVAGHFLRSPAVTFITLIPLVWLLAVTMTAGVQKIFHPDPRIGFLAQVKVLDGKVSPLEQAVETAKSAGNPEALAEAQKALRANRVLRFNNLLDAAVAGVFLMLVTAIVLLSVREWVLLLARRKLAVLGETPPVWLPDYAVVEAKPLHVVGLFTLALGLARELSGEAQLERARQAPDLCECAEASGQGVSQESRPGLRERSPELYVEVTERRFKGVNRCC
jgi:carbon starvation protein